MKRTTKQSRLGFRLNFNEIASVATLPRNDEGFRIPSAEIIGSSPRVTQLGITAMTGSSQ